MGLAFIAAHARGTQGQQWPQALATGGDDIFRQLRDQGHWALHILQDQAINLSHVIGQQATQRDECIGRRIGWLSGRWNGLYRFRWRHGASLS